MNDDSIPSLTGSIPLNRDDGHHDGESSRQPDRQDEPGEAERLRARTSKATVSQSLAVKLQFMTDLMSKLDMLVFVELCILYYMEYARIPQCPAGWLSSDQIG